MNRLLQNILLTVCLSLFTTVGFAKTTKVVIGGGPYLDIPQLSVAMDSNLWAENHLEAEVIPFRSGRAAFEALLGGQLDLAFMAEFPAVIGAMRKQNFRVISEMSQYKATRIIHGGDASINSVAKLAGKSIGVTMGTNVNFMLENELSAAGVTAELVSVSPPDIVQALSRGDIFAGAMFPSFYAGAKKVLGDRYQEIRVNSYGTHFILVATKELIDKNPDAVRGVLRALYDGEKVVRNSPSDSYKAVSRVLGGTLKPDQVASASKNYHFRMNLDKSMLDLMVKEGMWILGRGSIKADMPTAGSIRPYIDTSFLQSIDASRVNLK